MKISHILAGVLALSALLAPLMGLADTVDAAGPIAQAATGPGQQMENEIGKAVQDAVANIPSGPDSLVPVMALLVPITGVIFPMLVVIVIAWLSFRHRDRKEQRNHETIRQMIEKGMEIPPDLSFGREEPKSPLHTGLKYTGLGLGLIFFFLAMGMTDIAGIGAIPLFIGLAYLLIWRLENRRKSNG